MKKLLILISVLYLSACAAVPVERKFPDLPPGLETGCAELKLVPEGTTKLSETLVVVTDNYAQYHECKIKVETWQEWYKTQKKEFEKSN